MLSWHLFTQCRCVCLPRNFSSRDELGETLATLVFAQRAMSVTMDAHITVVPDLDARCQDLQRQLDNQSDRLTQMTLKKAAAEEGLELARDQLAQLFEEKNSTNARLQTVVEAYDRILKVLLAAGTCRTFTSQYPRVLILPGRVKSTVQILEEGGGSTCCPPLYCRVWQYRLSSLGVGSTVRAWVFLLHLPAGIRICAAREYDQSIDRKVAVAL